MVKSLILLLISELDWHHKYFLDDLWHFLVAIMTLFPSVKISIIPPMTDIHSWWIKSRQSSRTFLNLRLSLCISIISQEWWKTAQIGSTVLHYLTPHISWHQYEVRLFRSDVFKTQEFAGLINNFVLCNYLTVALINYTFKAHFQCWPQMPILWEHPERWGWERGGAGESEA